MKDWGDGKRFLFDHIFDSLVYGSIAVGAFFIDPILNALRALGLNVVPSEPMGHPYEIGKYQIAALIFSVLQILRLFQKFNEWKYYK